MWNIGSSASTTIRSPVPGSKVAALYCTTFDKMVRCVSMTPFCRPVVPEEYGSAASASKSLAPTGSGAVLAMSDR